MKWQFCLLLLICHLGLTCNSLLYAQAIKPPRTVMLGTAHGKTIVCRISLVLIDKEVDQDEVRLEFQARDRAGRVRAFRVKTGLCFGSDPATLDISVEDYVGRGRKQVFISASYGATTSRLYDCDGGSLRTLYSRDGGHFGSRFARGRDGHWRLVEDWRYDEYLDNKDENLGGATIITAPHKNSNGIIHRTLHWNGHGFVPDYPGPTRIVK